MAVYRTSDSYATRLVRELGRRGIGVRVERYGAVIYAVVDSDRDDIDQLVRSQGEVVVVPDLEQLSEHRPPNDS